MTPPPDVPWPARRVRGLETEYGLALSLERPDGGRRRVGVDEAARLLFRPLTTSLATTSAFLRNGGRMYLDVGSHPEYATPECDDLLDLVAHDRAGDAIMSRLADRALELLADEGQVGHVQLHRNNLDSHGNSYGSHENYQVSRTTTLREHAAALTPFLVVRQLLCGAGAWVVDRATGRGRFWVSQRAAHMWDPLSSTTTRSRPMINTRDEPHADPQRFRRLHVIVGDSNLSQPTLLLRVGSTELVLRAIEAGERFDDLALTDPAAAIRDVSHDTTGRARLDLAAGGTIAALEVLQRVRDRVAHTADTPDLLTALALWDTVVGALADGRLDRVERSIDWVVRLRLLQRYGDRHRLGPDDARLAQVDLAFSDIRPGQGLFGRLEAAGQVETLVPVGAVEAAVEQPPATRAALRGRLVEAAQRLHRTATVDWMTTTVRDLPDGTVVLPDPLRSEDERVERLLRRMATEPRAGSSASFTQPAPAPHIGPRQPDSGPHQGS